MSRKNRYGRDIDQEQDDIKQEETVQNTAPMIFMSFDQFWSTCIKNGTPLIKEACIAHLKSIKSWDSPEKWIEGVQNFGITIEK